MSPLIALKRLSKVVGAARKGFHVEDVELSKEAAELEITLIECDSGKITELVNELLQVDGGEAAMRVRFVRYASQFEREDHQKKAMGAGIVEMFLRENSMCRISEMRGGGSMADILPLKRLLLMELNENVVVLAFAAKLLEKI
jgi:hypothetical protein